MTLAVEKINSFYGTSHILHDLSLKIGKGELFAVLGRNGAGKSTLMKSIMGLNVPKSGQITYDGIDIKSKKSHERARLGISYVPQGREIIPDITVEENIHVALLGKGRKANGIPEFVFDYFPALRDTIGRKGGVLSGGQQQQLAIARALAQEPTLLLMDEPTEGLQPSVVEEIHGIMNKIPEERGCGVLLVEQNLDFVRGTTENFAILDTGRMVARGRTEELTDDLAHQHLSV